MTDAVKRARELLDATPGPNGVQTVMDLIAAAPDLLRELCEEVEELSGVCQRWQSHFTDTPGLAAANAEIVSLRRELERWRHGSTVEGDFVCPDSLQLTVTRAALREACEIANRIERDSGDWKPDDADRLAELAKLAEEP